MYLNDSKRQKQKAPETSGAKGLKLYHLYYIIKMVKNELFQLHLNKVTPLSVQKLPNIWVIAKK